MDYYGNYIILKKTRNRNRSHSSYTTTWTRILIPTMLLLTFVTFIQSANCEHHHHYQADQTQNSQTTAMENHITQIMNNFYETCAEIVHNNLVLDPTIREKKSRKGFRNYPAFRQAPAEVISCTMTLTRDSENDPDPNEQLQRICIALHNCGRLTEANSNGISIHYSSFGYTSKKNMHKIIMLSIFTSLFYISSVLLLLL